MKMQWLRNPSGRLRGVALLFGDGVVLAGQDPKEKEGWRLCEGCYSKPATLFCRTHSRYVCEGCLHEHAMPSLCSYLSVAAARQLVSIALKGEPQWP